MSDDHGYEKIRKLHKAIAWSEAKAALRKVVDIDGQIYGGDRVAGKMRHEVVGDHVEAFIKDFSYQGYDE